MANEDRGQKRAVAPYALALVVCDAIYLDPATGKRTLLGCFSTIGAPEFPATHPMLAVYAAVTDAHGTVPLTLRLVDADEGREPVFEVTNEISCPDPRTVVEINFAVGNLRFPAPGEYRLQLLSGGMPLLERRILLLKIQRNENE
jgi:hypothetical protein